ncbi:hypothetical protein GCM10029992_33080 [Glycomyces albus]
MTEAGAPQIDVLDPYVRQEAETIAWANGVETEPSSEGGMNVGWIENGDWIEVKGADFGSGAASFNASVASGGGGGDIEIRLGGPTGTLVGTCEVPVTGGWQTWTTVSCPVAGATGAQDLYLRFTGGADYLFNMDWWRFDPSGGGGLGELRAVGAERCLDVPNQSTENGAQVQIWDCGGGPGQQWDYTDAGELSVYSGGSRKCLDAEGAGTSNGTAAIIWDCHGGSNQRWEVNADGSITSAASGLCLDVSGASTSNGSLVQLWTCHGGSNQRWAIV